MRGHRARTLKNILNGKSSRFSSFFPPLPATYLFDRELKKKVIRRIFSWQCQFVSHQ